MKLSVVIPAYNEEKRIASTLNSISQYLRKQNYDWEIVVVIDGAKDNTYGAALEAQKAIPELRIINNQINHGKGYVVRQAMTDAKGDFRLFMDADNSTDISEIGKFWHWFDNGYDIVIGSIEVEGAKITEKAGWHRRILGHLAKLIIRVMLIWEIKDTQRGFKCFSKRTIEPIFSRQKIERWGFDFEILYIAKKHGFKIKEVPVIWNNPAESKVKLSGYITTFKELVKVRWNSILGVYR